MNGTKFCLWSGPAFAVLFGMAVIFLAGFMPAPAPSLSAEAIAVIFRENTVSIRLGVAVMMVSAAFILPFAGLISERMHHIEGCNRSLIYGQMLCGIMGVAVITIAALCWGWAAFRPERDPVITQTINDLGWLCLLTTVGGPVLQPAMVGIAILGDRAAQPVFPRWVGFFNLWIALLFVPGVTALFFITGPFAWNGLFPYWIPFAAFGAWFVVMFFVLKASLARTRSG